MTYSVLVGTPNAAFGELIRISLEENAEYRVRLVHHAGQVLATMERIPVDLAILDADLPGQPFISLALELMGRFKGLKLMVIPPDNNPAHPALHGLVPHSYLNKPFYLPDLLETIERLLKGDLKDLSRPNQPIASVKENLSQNRSTSPLPSVWVDTPSVEQKIGELLPGSSILECLILQSTHPWVYAGKLSEKEINELGGMFNRLVREGKGSLIRFTRLSSGHEYLLYAAGLVGDLHLVLIFAGNYPLSRLRSQASEFRTDLLTIFTSPQSAAAVVDSPELSGDQEILDGSTREAIEHAFNEPMTMEEFEGEEDEAEPINLNEILGDIPSPDPGNTQPAKTTKSAGWQPNEGSGLKDLEDTEPPTTLVEPVIKQPPLVNWDQMVIDELSSKSNDIDISSIEDTQPVIPQKKNNGNLKDWGDIKRVNSSDKKSNGSVPPFITGTKPVSPPNLPGIKNSGEEKSKEEPDSGKPPFDWIDNEDAWAEVVFGEASSSKKSRTISSKKKEDIQDTQPIVIQKITRISELETAYPAYSSLAYTFILIPALPGVLLLGDLAGEIVRWVPQLCLAYGWRLDQVQVRPQYVQWSVRVLPYGSPGNIANTMRLQLSNQVLRHHLDLEDMLPSGEFWAPGYLVINGAQSASNQLIKELITDIRKRQGVEEGVAADGTINPSTDNEI